ncbi:MAG: hypothetical protein IBX69_14425 [Anaerolineales bacterium]|nr:hypothetical protein [Anaerolineales bacterium]
MRRGLLFFAFFGIILLAACSRTQPEEIEPTPTEQQLITDTPQIVSPTATVETGYPAPEFPTIPPPYPVGDPSPEPTLEIIDLEAVLDNLTPGLGAVTGVLLDNKQPRPNAIIYLADVIPDDEGIERVASYDRSSSPRSNTDSLGRFVFANIPPGRYGLILDTVISAYLLHFPNEDLPLLFTVEADDLEDIGELDYDNLPMP